MCHLCTEVAPAGACLSPSWGWHCWTHVWNSRHVFCLLAAFVEVRQRIRALPALDIGIRRPRILGLRIILGPGQEDPSSESLQTSRISTKDRIRRFFNQVPALRSFKDYPFAQALYRPSKSEGADTLLYSTLLYSTLLYYTLLYYTILYYTGHSGNALGWQGRPVAKRAAVILPGPWDLGTCRCHRDPAQNGNCIVVHPFP